jgi:Uncharacterised nucleotidyltransferase
MDEHEDARPKVSGKSSLKEFAVRSRTVARRARVDAEAVRALDALARAGVDALLLKGAALATTLYRVDEPRGYYDVDLLVAPRDLRVAAAAIADLGYTNVGELRGIDDVAGILHAQVWSALVEGLGNLLVDLHWRLDGCQAPPEVAWNVLKPRRGFIELAGRRVPTLDQAGLALHLALHAAQHGPGDLQAMGDLERGLERWPAQTWRQASRLAHDLAGTEALAGGLRLVPAGVGLSRELRLPPADALLWAIAHRDTRPRGTFHLDAFAQASSLPERIDVLRRSLLPARAWILWEYRWAGENRARTLAAYIIHIARAPVWAARSWRFRRGARRAAT